MLRTTKEIVEVYEWSCPKCGVTNHAADDSEHELCINCGELVILFDDEESLYQDEQEE